MERFHSPFGEFNLQRWPLRPQENLRAWDAADELLLQHLAAHEAELLATSPRVMVINDGFGALACALAQYQPVSWSDSSVSHFATQQNLKLNNGDTASLERLKSTETPCAPVDLVLIKVPKTTALLEDQLIRLRPCLHKDSVIIATGMVKHLQRSAFQCIEKVIGPLTTSLAKKKARLIFATLDEALVAPANPYPSKYTEASIGLTLSNHAGVFSRERLDLGARFFLTQFSNLPAAERVIDLACGNGVLGIKYQQQYADASVCFVDESYMAVASAKENYQAVFPESHSAHFQVGDGLKQCKDESVDLIVCNPPFHQQHVIGEQIALEMFQDSKRSLVKGGELWIVANRHLSYQSKLKHLFGHTRVIAANKKFVVLKMQKR